MIEYRIDRLTRQVIAKYPQGEYDGDDDTDALAFEHNIPMPCYQRFDEILPGDNPIAYQMNRQEAYENKGWFTQFDIVDDAMKRGWEAVFADRDAIKSEFPKPEAKK